MPTLAEAAASAGSIAGPDGQQPTATTTTDPAVTVTGGQSKDEEEAAEFVDAEFGSVNLIAKLMYAQSAIMFRQAELATELFGNDNGTSSNGNGTVTEVVAGENDSTKNVPKGKSRTSLPAELVIRAPAFIAAYEMHRRETAKKALKAAKEERNATVAAQIREIRYSVNYAEFIIYIFFLHSFNTHFLASA